LDLLVHLGVMLLPDILPQFQVVDGGREETLDVGELSAAGRHLDVQLNELDGPAVGLDDLAREVAHVPQPELVMYPLWLDRRRCLDLVVLEAALVALERHENNLTEVRN